MKNRNFSLAALAGLLTLALSGCGILSPVQTPEITQYQIAFSGSNTKKPQTQKAPAQSAMTLFVSPISADEPYNTTLMHYKASDYALASYHLSQWVAPPNQMMTQTFARAFMRSHRFDNIVSGNFIGYADYRLSGHLNQLTQTITSSETSIVVSAYFTLTRTDNGQIIASRIFNLRHKGEPNAKSYAQVANQLVNQLSGEVKKWILSADHKTIKTKPQVPQP